MTGNGILLDKVNLHYSSVAFKERSLKALITGAFTAPNAKTVVHDIHALKNICVEIAPGERVGLVGHSGSGKTTFVKLIQRLYDVNAGRILIDGQDIAGVAQASLRAQIAIVQQEPILFHRSLAENIAYARPSATQAEIEHAARLASAHGGSP